MKGALIAIEAPFFGKNVQSMLKLGRAQGVAMAAGLSRQIPITEYEPKKIKMAIVKNLKKDINIKYVILISIFLGMVSTSRIIFFFVPFLFYFLLNPYHKKNSIILLIISSIIFWGFNTYFYFINKIYQPLHFNSVLNKKNKKELK